MNKHSIHTFVGLLFFSLTAAYAEGLPFYPEAVQTIGRDQPNSVGSSRLRVNLSSEINEADDGVTVGNITACTDSACYRPIATPQNIRIFNTENGKSTQVAEFIIPRKTITSIHFESVAAAKYVSGDIQISTPLKFDLEYFGEDILVVLKKNIDKATIKYIPDVAVAAPFHYSSEAIYYNPYIATTAKLPMGTTLSIPARATSQPQIFSIAVFDTNGIFPLGTVCKTSPDLA